MRSEYVKVREDLFPIVHTIREKYEEMYLFGTLEENCKKFGLSTRLVEKIAYPKHKDDITGLTFDTIIRLSNLFEIPYEDFINYNASVYYHRDKENKDIIEEENMLKQYSAGKSWEDKIINYYNNRNYFVYKMPTMNDGTVFDIIAIKKGSALLIECKHIESDKLYYKGSGLLKKRDELDHLVDTTQNNIYIYVSSDKTGTWWTTWKNAKPIFEEKGYITADDCLKCDISDK